MKGAITPGRAEEKPPSPAAAGDHGCKWAPTWPVNECVRVSMGGDRRNVSLAYLHGLHCIMFSESFPEMKDLSTLSSPKPGLGSCQVNLDH